MPKRAQYSVGYAKPPVETRFERGVSGNSKGRPKGSKNWSTTLNHALNELVTVKTANGSRQMSRFEAAATQLAMLASSGNLNAMKLVLSLAPLLEQAAGQEQPTTKPIGKSEMKLLQNLIKRLPAS